MKYYCLECHRLKPRRQVVRAESGGLVGWKCLLCRSGNIQPHEEDPSAVTAKSVLAAHGAKLLLAG